LIQHPHQHPLQSQLCQSASVSYCTTACITFQQATGHAGIPGYMYSHGPGVQSIQFHRSVEALHIAKTQDTSSYYFLTEADKAEMQRLAAGPDIGQDTSHCHWVGF